MRPFHSLQPSPSPLKPPPEPAQVTHKLYGPTVDSAFNLGEDVASGGEVLVDEPVYNKIKRSRLFAELEFQRKVRSD